MFRSLVPSKGGLITTLKVLMPAKAWTPKVAPVQSYVSAMEKKKKKRAAFQEAVMKGTAEDVERPPETAPAWPELAPGQDPMTLFGELWKKPPKRGEIKFNASI